jgi:hypothetical protein
MQGSVGKVGIRHPVSFPYAGAPSSSTLVKNEKNGIGIDFLKNNYFIISTS